VTKFAESRSLLVHAVSGRAQQPGSGRRSMPFIVVAARPRTTSELDGLVAKSVLPANAVTRACKLSGFRVRAHRYDRLTIYTTSSVTRHGREDMVRLIVTFCAFAFAVAPVARAQTFQVIDIDPSLRVHDINNHLIGVGVTSNNGTPFILSPTGVRLFPQFPLVRPLRINDSGVIVGQGTLSSLFGIFRVGADGTDYTEIGGSLDKTAVIVQLTENGRALLHTYSGLFRKVPDFTGAFLWDGTNLISASTVYGLPLEAFINDLSEDGTIGGELNGQPFLKRPGEPLLQPWSGGRVKKIGPAGDIVGADGADLLIVRRPDGSIETYPELGGAVAVSGVNRSGEGMSRGLLKFSGGSGDVYAI
jgi:hypothetical protein